MIRFAAGSMMALAILAGSILCSVSASAQDLVIPVWPGAAPGSEDWSQKEVEYLNGKQRMVRNVVKPTLTVYLPDRAKANGTAIVICPGGGFRFLSWDSEGVEVAKWLMERGVSAFVLKYRLVDTGATEEEFQKRVADLFRGPNSRNTGNEPPDPRQEELKRKVPSLAAADGREAVKIVRRRAAEWGIAPDRIGIMGFSAGGAVTMGVVMEHSEDSRPNFAAPIYGGGTNNAPVPPDAPPLFILVANDDKGASVGSAKLYTEWKTADKPAELHIYSKGGHGFGMNKRGLPVDSWIERFGDWLAVQGLLKPPR